MSINAFNFLLQTDTKKQDLIKVAQTSFERLLKKKYSPEKAREKVLEETGVVL